MEPKETLKPTHPKTKIWPWILLAGIILFAVLVRLSLRSEFVFNLIKSEIENAVSEQTGGTLIIGKMDGDLLNYIRLSDITLSTHEPVLTLDSLYAEYSVYSLFSKKLDLKKLTFWGADAFISQENDSLWNVTPLLNNERTPDDSEGGLGFDISVKDIQFNDGSANVKSELLPDGAINLEEIELSADFYLIDDIIDLSLNSLSFHLKEGRLPEPVTFDAKAQVSGENITLEKLIIQSSRSMLSSKGQMDLENNQLSTELNLNPIHNQDISAYLDNLPAFETAVIGFKVNGDFSDIEINASMEAPGFLNAEVLLQGGFQPDLVLNELQLLVSDFNPAAIPGTGNFQTFKPGTITFEANGSFYPNKPETSALIGSLNISESDWEQINNMRFKADFDLNEGDVSINTTLRLPDQSVNINLFATRVFEDLDKITWNMQSILKDVNAGKILNDETFASKINGTLNATGTGMEPGSEPWEIQLNLTTPEVAGFDFEKLSLDATVSERQAEILTEIRKNDSEVQVNASVSNWKATEPEWKFTADVVALDLESFAKIEGFQSNLNATLSGSATGFDPQKMAGTFLVHLQPSFIINQRVDSVKVDIEIANGILEIPKALIQSRFIVGELTAVQNLLDFSDISNTLTYSLEILNVEPFAESAGLDTLSVTGNISGEMFIRNNKLQFENDYSFENVVANNLLMDGINGSLFVLLEETPELTIDIFINNPVYDAVNLEDIVINSTIQLGDIITGNSIIDIAIEDENGLKHESSFSIDGDAISINTNRFDVHEDEFDLSLENPFSIHLHEEGIEMDTMRVVSTKQAYLELHFSEDSQVNRALYFSADDIDLGALQRVVLHDVIMDGTLSAEVQSDFTDLDIKTMTLTASVDSVDFLGLDLDVLNLDLLIENDRLTTDFSVARKGNPVIVSEFNLPFKSGDPETFSDDFFEEFVEGFLRIEPQLLKDYEPIFQLAGLETVEGLLQGNLSLKGVAGNPQLGVQFLLKDARFSGVPVDSLSLNLDYEHENGRMHIDSELISLGQDALLLEGSFPFLIDLRTFEIREKERFEQLDFSLISNEFDLTTLNVFLDRDIVQSLRGLLTTEVQVKGTVDEPEVRGTINLRRGQVFLVDNNITLRNIQMESRLSPGEFHLQRLSAESVGTMNLSGKLYLDGFTPVSVDFTADAQRFRAFQTRDIEILTTLNARLTGSEKNPRITGEILMDRGFLYLDNFGEATLEEVVLEDEKETESLFDDLYEKAEIEMSLRVDRRFFVRNRNRPELDLELEGLIEAVKEPNRELELFGDMNVVEGTANQLGRRFDLDEGQVLFSGPADNPEMNVRLKYQLRREDDITIWYVIKGTAQEPVFTYESEPEMELQDIISYTIFGRPFNALAGWQQGVSGGAGGSNIVADAALDLLLDRLETLTAERLGIDVLEIDQSSGNSGTSIKAGKYFGDKLFVAIVQELSSDPVSQVIIEYLLRRNLELIFTGSDDYRTGVDIRWRLDY